MSKALYYKGLWDCWVVVRAVFKHDTLLCGAKFGLPTKELFCLP